MQLSLPAPTGLVKPTVLIGLLIVADQATKLWALNTLTGGAVTVVPNYFDFSLAFNFGVSFSLFGGGELPYQRWLLSALGLVITAVFAGWMYQRRGDFVAKYALAMVIAGALGNVIDRVRLGAVVDFISLHFQTVYYWPTFNVADMCITGGIALLLLQAVYAKLPANKEE